MTALAHTGGCQCGAVRFRVVGAVKDASICHCRMCQKAFGGYYAPLVPVGDAVFAWTRGEPKRFRSSNAVERGFCSDCGTPLTFEAPDGLAIAAGAFDDPSLFPPTIQFGTEAKIGFVDALHRLPAETTESDVETARYLLTLVSYQHPDHDTPDWPPQDMPR